LKFSFESKLFQCFLFALGLSVFLGCQTKPTEIKNQSQVQQVTSEEKEVAEIKKLIQEKDPVIMDTRSSQEFFLSHIPQSHYANPREYMSLKNDKDYFVLADRESITRRWALLGIAPETPVVVVGKGLSGAAEQAWWAWFLKGLGVQDVRLAHVDEFRMRPYEPNAAKRENKAFWNPKSELNESSLQELKSELKLGSSVVIDTTEKSVLKSQSESKLGAQKSKILMKPWKSFFKANSRIRPEVEQELLAMGLTKEKQIILVCDDGLSAGAVDFVLQSLGYAKTKVFPGPISSLKTLFLKY